MRYKVGYNGLAILTGPGLLFGLNNLRRMKRPSSGQKTVAWGELCCNCAALISIFLLRI